MRLHGTFIRILFTLLLAFIGSCAAPTRQPSDTVVHAAFKIATNRAVTFDEFNHMYTIERVGEGDVVVHSPQIESCFPEQLRTAEPPIKARVYRIVIASRTDLSDTTHLAFDDWPAESDWWVTHLRNGKNECFTLNR
jgi:hypothetical protein